MNQNILIVTTNFPPSTSIGTQRILKICKFLDPKYTIHVLTLKEKYYSSGKRDDDAQILERNGRLNIWRTDKIDLYSYLIRMKERIITQKKPDNPVILKSSKKEINERKSLMKLLKRQIGLITDLLEFPDKDICWLPISVFKGFFIIRHFNIDIIFASAPKHSNLLISLILKRLTGKKMVADFRDPWARSPWLGEQRAASAFERLKHKIIVILEKLVVEASDQVVFTTQALKDDFLKQYPHLPDDKFKAFYNGYDPDRVRDKSITRGRYRAGSSEEKRIIFSHIGSLYKKRNPENLILAIKNLIDTNQIQPVDILFRFIGNIGKDIQYIEKLLTDLKLEDVVHFIPPVSYNESHKFMEKSDILILLQPEAKLMLPAKFFDYMCFNKTIFALGEKGGEVENVVAGKFGIFADYTDTDGIQEGILKLVQNPCKYDDLIKRNRTTFDMSKSIAVFEQTLDTV